MAGTSCQIYLVYVATNTAGNWYEVSWKTSSVFTNVIRPPVTQAPPSPPPPAWSRAINMYSERDMTCLFKKSRYSTQPVTQLDLSKSYAKQFQTQPLNRYRQLENTSQIIHNYSGFGCKKKKKGVKKLRKFTFQCEVFHTICFCDGLPKVVCVLQPSLYYRVILTSVVPEFLPKQTALFAKWYCQSGIEPLSCGAVVYNIVQ